MNPATIILSVDRDVLANIKTLLILKQGCGELHGEIDEFAYRVVRAMDEGKPELKLGAKKPLARRAQ